jgi:uncharacterized membrane protein YqhA|tara:strand:+ start:1330 stop:1542 length:213 start_codon:yes stop_codon:yes gene_type:complete
MKIKQFRKFDNQIENNKNFNIINKNIKTTNINILLNRVRQEKKDYLKKKVIFSILIISTLSFLSIMIFAN